MNNPNIIEKELSYKIMGILFDVHNQLGGEYQEKYYQRAVAKALKREKIEFKEQLEVDLKFADEKIGKYLLDFLVKNKIVLEIKAVPRLKPIYFRQIHAYLKARNLELGILVNFKGDKLTYKRILYPIRTKNSDNSHSDPFVLLAQQTIEHYIKTGKTIEIPSNLPEKMTVNRAGTFVSLHLKDGSLRGCIGTFLPTRKNIAEEVIGNAIAAATQDPRFLPVDEAELSDLVYSVDILSEPQPTDRQQIDPKKYGLIVSSADGRKGLLLPDIPGVETSEYQIEICRQKGGIGPFEPVKFEIFTVERHEEK